ncbi:MAG: hydrogenobyrinic acid a,c-diamide synthase (glutamine-hydrolyzing) [Thermodesulfovibrionales bacterium]|nr:hydrogenobyrinic acid a,c-diamide synthase (glutamine-hydrolyzing) [Thermodesulfovibrionales bacterium]
MNKEYPRLVIAGIRGGCGKTTVSLSIITALKLKKLQVTPFKKGPDYIDSGWLSLFANNTCYNLDPFLISKENVVNSFVNHFKGDLALIEGNRGLFDGMDAEGSYSTAELSKLLKSPIILVVDCSKVTRTVAAIIKGCIEFDRSIQISGVILNQIAGKRHENIIKASIEKYCSLPVVGAIPRMQDDSLPERHMGLVPYQEHQYLDRANSFIQMIADRHLDIDKIADIAFSAPPLSLVPEKSEEGASFKVEDSNRSEYLKIGVLKDPAFQFYYPENLEELQKRGAEIVEINALIDQALPDIDALYIGGGFPETNAVHLAENESFKTSLRKAAEGGLPIYAECGGLMFLGRKIRVDNKNFSMVNLFPITFKMKGKPQAHGYTIIEVDQKNPFLPIGTILHGHEFHYSLPEEFSENENIYTVFKMKRGEGIKNKRDGLCYKNALGTYTHIHALGSTAWINGLINSAKEYKFLRSKLNHERK